MIYTFTKAARAGHKALLLALALWAMPLLVQAQLLVAPLTADQIDSLNRHCSRHDGYYKFCQQRLLGVRDSMEVAIIDSSRRDPLKINDVALINVDTNGHPLVLITHNVGAAVSHGTNLVQPGGALGTNLAGRPSRLHEWDGGAVRRTHAELTGRVLQADGATSLSDHATHVAGTLIARGANANARGMAFQGVLSAYDWLNDESEMAAAASAGAIISNHSYGVIAGWNYTNNAWYWYGSDQISTSDDYKYGYYDQTARNWDQIAANAPYYLIVKSAGNNRGMPGPTPGTQHYVWSTASGSWVLSTATRRQITGYDCIPTAANAKNILTIGAVEDLPNPNTRPITMSSFSSWGPTDDGRVKPDLVANGVGLTSSTAGSDNAYSIFSGTSMASPAATGGLILVQEQYQKTHRRLMRAPTLKALAIHTARDAGNAGPDYVFGHGLLNIANMVTAINQQGATIAIKEKRLASGGAFDTTFAVTGSNIPQVTLVWNDVPGAVSNPVINSRSRKLVNDLDVRLIAPNGTTYSPFVLNPNSPSALATRGDNIIDNVERVIGAAGAGNWRVRVTHKGTLSGGGQDYSLIISGMGGAPGVAPFAIQVTSPKPFASVRVTDSLTVTWFNNGSGNAYNIRLLQGSTVVSTLATNYSNGARQFVWRVPASTANGTYTIRVEDASSQATAGVSQPFTVTGGTVAGPPTIASFSPTAAATSASIVITGNNLSTATAVRFNGVNATFTLSGNNLLAVVPAGATTGNITIVNPAGTATSLSPFTVLIPTCAIAPSLGQPLVFSTTNQTRSLAAGTTHLIPFVANSPGTYRFSTCGANIDTRIRLFNATGLPLGDFDDNGPFCTGSAASGQISTLSAGQTYYVLVTLSPCLPLTAAVNLQYSYVAATCALPTPYITPAGPIGICGTSQVLSASTAPAGATYLWSNGSNSQSILVNATGTYSVRYVQGTCTSAVSNAVVLQPGTLPTPSVTPAGPLSICPGSSVTLTASQLQTGATYLWSTGATGPTINVSAAGTYSVRAVAGTCTSAVSNAVTVSVGTSGIPAPTITTSTGGTTVCTGNTLVLRSSAATGNLWSTGSSTQTLTVGPGTYTLRVISSGCTSATATITITQVANTVPVPTITVAGNTALCTGQAVTLYSSAGANTFWSNGSRGASLVVTTAGNWTARAIADACTSAASAPVTTTVTPVATPTISVSGSTTLCPGSTVTLTSNLATGNLWSNGATSQSITVAQAGVYSVRQVNGVCTSANSLPVQVSSLTAFGAPVIVATDGQNVADSIGICQGQSVTLTSTQAPDGGSYQWSNGATTQTITVNTPGTYTVVLAGGTCATSTSAPFTVRQFPAPDTSFSYRNDSLVASYSAPNASYQWLLDGVPVVEATGRSFRPHISGNYALEVSNGGCRASSRARFITGLAYAKAAPSHLRLKPNPVTDGWLELDGTAVAVPLELVVTNYLGQTVLTQRLDLSSGHARVHLGPLPTGVYTVGIGQGHSRQVYRVVVQ